MLLIIFPQNTAGTFYNFVRNKQGLALTKYLRPGHNRRHGSEFLYIESMQNIQIIVKHGD